MKKSKEHYFWGTLLNYLAYSLFYFLITLIIYHQFLHETNAQIYWVGIPLLLYILSIYMGKLVVGKESTLRFFSIVCLISLILSFLYLQNDRIKIWILQYFDIVTFIVIAVFLLNLIVRKGNELNEELEGLEEPEKELFNLFYINTSKVHEIAMLIDNKIMKTIEKEQVSEELLKYSNTINLEGKGGWNADLGYSKDEGIKKRVYENFDVKITKSIMLQKIYDNIQKNNNNSEKLSLGDLTIFEDVELQQRNIDDTVMILNALQDSKIKSNPNEEVELNLTKMMDKMLDDFTIDYTFTYGSQAVEQRYIIQLPYKNTDYFENGYHHNDLQLGRLSLIGIYRGEIDFSTKDSTSSKFLELMSESYKNELQHNISSTMNKSNSAIEQSGLEIKFNHNKLNEKLHLIDVIAIIQDLNIERGS